MLSVDKESNLNFKIYALNGGLVREMFLGRFQAGTYNIEWDGKDQLSNRSSSGVYIYRFESGLHWGRQDDLVEVSYIGQNFEK